MLNLLSLSSILLFLMGNWHVFIVDSLIHNSQFQNNLILKSEWWISWIMGNPVQGKTGHCILHTSHQSSQIQMSKLYTVYCIHFTEIHRCLFVCGKEHVCKIQKQLPNANLQAQPHTIWGHDSFPPGSCLWGMLPPAALSNQYDWWDGLNSAA